MSPIHSGLRLPGFDKTSISFPSPSKSGPSRRRASCPASQSQRHSPTHDSRRDIYSHPAVVEYAAARRPHQPIPKFGPYLLLQTLGEGEFGKVKLGLHRQLGEQVAVKLIRRSVVDPSEIEYEIGVLKTLRHPNIVRLRDVVETDKYTGMILEYASGGELFDYIVTQHYLQEQEACKLFSQLISGVWYMHQKNIVHRDLKPDNLLLDQNNNVIITDFGFANRFEPKSPDDSMMMKTSCGSPCYAAPELFSADGYVGSAVDVWSCGVILYAMLAGYLPFHDDPANPEGENIDLLYKYIVNTPLSFPDYFPPDAKDIISIMLVADPKLRADLGQVMNHRWPSPYVHVFSKSIGELEYTAAEKSQARGLEQPIAVDTELHTKRSSSSARHAKSDGILPLGRSRSQIDRPHRTLISTETRRYHSQITLPSSSKQAADGDSSASKLWDDKTALHPTPSSLGETLKPDGVRNRHGVREDSARSATDHPIQTITSDTEKADCRTSRRNSQSCLNEEPPRMTVEPSSQAQSSTSPATPVSQNIQSQIQNRTHSQSPTVSMQADSFYSKPLSDQTFGMAPTSNPPMSCITPSSQPTVTPVDPVPRRRNTLTLTLSRNIRKKANGCAISSKFGKKPTSESIELVIPVPPLASKHVPGPGAKIGSDNSAAACRVAKKLITWLRNKQKMSARG